MLHPTGKCPQSPRHDARKTKLHDFRNWLAALKQAHEMNDVMLIEHCNDALEKLYEESFKK